MVLQQLLFDIGAELVLKLCSHFLLKLRLHPLADFVLLLVAVFLQALDPQALGLLHQLLLVLLAEHLGLLCLTLLVSRSQLFNLLEVTLPLLFTDVFVLLEDVLFLAVYSLCELGLEVLLDQFNLLVPELLHEGSHLLFVLELELLVQLEAE